MRTNFARWAGWWMSFALAVALGIGGVSAAATPAAGLDSGAIGLTRVQFEATYGAPTKTATVPGLASDETYAYGTQAGMIYVTYRDLNGEQVAVAVEFAWGGNGVTEAAAAKTLAAFLPSDAKLSERYVMPATPDGPITLVAIRYASAALTGASGGVLAPEILAIQHETWDASAGAMKVTRIGLALRDRTQLTS